VQPSSLVFLAIIAMWAAYLLPQWVRRRDAMGQSRGRDRDSGALRVLRPRLRPTGGRSTAPLLMSGNVQDGSELDAVIKPDSPQTEARRAVAGRPDAAARPAGTRADGSAAQVPTTGGSAAPARSTAVSGTTSASGTTSVSGTTSASGTTAGRPPAVRGDAGTGAPARPHASGSGRDGHAEPESGRAGAAGGRMPAADGSRSGTVRVAVTEQGTPRRPVRGQASTHPGTLAPPGTPAPAPAGTTAAGRAAAIRRARVLAVLLLSTVVSWLAVALSLVQAVVAIAVTALLIADLFALRSVARRREVLRRQAATSQRPVAAAATSTEAGADGGAELAARAAAAGTRRSTSRTSGAPLRRTLPPAAVRRPAAHRVGKREVEATEAGRPTSDGTWMPVPVPPPTYTLKPMAPRPEPPVLNLDGGHPAGPAGPGGSAGTGAATDGAGGAGPVVVGSEGIAPPTPGPVPDRYEGVEPAAAQERPVKRPWDDDHEWADELDLDAVLARRRAVNG
jgi:hypothetical protein